MVREQYEALKGGENLRKGLIGLKQALKEEGARKELLEALQGDYALLRGFLSHEDPKVRGNAAMVLGRLGRDENAGAVYEAYLREEKLFVRSNYLDALACLDISGCRDGLERRLQELEAYQPKEEEEKHIRQELFALRKLLPDEEAHGRHVFTGYDETYGVFLTTGSCHQEVTAAQVKGGKATARKGGVRVVTRQIAQVMAIPTYREMLFLLDIGKVGPDPKEAARELAGSSLCGLLQKAHPGQEGAFFFRLGIHGQMKLDARSAFAKKCAFALEQETGGLLRNSTSDYEVEIRLMENEAGFFLPLVKLYTYEDKRFSYRKRTVASSMRPEQAALAARLAEPYLAARARVLDPFCGVGTMLLERDRVRPARAMCGIDHYGEAVQGARENARRAGKEARFIQCDFFRFQTDGLFDEIMTDMPMQGKMSREELDQMYGAFFGKAETLLTEKGKMILCSDEKNLVKKQIRLHKAFCLLAEYDLDGKGTRGLFVIGKKVEKGHRA